MTQNFLITIWAFTVGLGIFRYFEEDICLACFKHGRKVVSFIIGAMISIIFLELLMDVYRNINSTNELLALFLPLGFIISFLIEKHIYSHPKRKNKKEELHKMYVIVSSISAFFLGIIFATDLQSTMFKEILLLVTFCLFHIMGSMYVHHIDEKETSMRSKKIKRLLYGASPVYGLLLGLSLNLSEPINVALLAIFAGAMMHIIVDDIMTEEKKTNVGWFLAGTLFFTGLFAMDIFLL